MSTQTKERVLGDTVKWENPHEYCRSNLVVSRDLAAAAAGLAVGELLEPDTAVAQIHTTTNTAGAPTADGGTFRLGYKGQWTTDLAFGVVVFVNRVLVYSSRRGVDFTFFYCLFWFSAMAVETGSTKLQIQNPHGGLDSPAHPDPCLPLSSKQEQKILRCFKQYLQWGYYPYYTEFNNKELFYLTVEQNIHTTLESDLVNIYPSLTGTSIKNTGIRALSA